MLRNMNCKITKLTYCWMEKEKEREGDKKCYKLQWNGIIVGSVDGINLQNRSHRTYNKHTYTRRCALDSEIPFFLYFHFHFRNWMQIPLYAIISRLFTVSVSVLAVFTYSFCLHVPFCSFCFVVCMLCTTT